MCNSTMEKVIQGLGSNKVIIPIVTNRFEETNPYVEEESLFDELDNLYDIYKKMPKQKAQQHSNNIITGVDGIVSCILESLDGKFSLMSSKSKHIDTFKKNVLLNLDTIKLKPKITVEQFDKMYKENDEKICSIFSHILKKRIAIQQDDQWFVYGKDYKTCMVIYKVNHQYSLFDGDVSYNNIERRVIKSKIERLLGDNFEENLNAMLLKDLKHVADELELPTYKLEDNKKKNYLKAELKEQIINYIKLY